MKAKKCFIAAPVSADTGKLCASLEKRGIEWRDVTTFPLGRSIGSSIELAIGQSDFVCVVLTRQGGSPNVFFEMGLARGKGRPLLVFATPDVEIPFDLQDVGYARVEMGDSAALEFHLDAFLKYGLKRTRVSRVPSPVRNPGTDVSWVAKDIDLIARSSQPRYSSQIEELVAHLFERAGCVVSRTTARDAGADMSVWIDELNASFQNPLLVEVKAGNLTEKKLVEAEERLRVLCSKIRAGAGMVIYHGGKFGSKDGERLIWPLVFRFSLEELTALIGSGGLSSEIIRRRNSLVHEPR